MLETLLSLLLRFEQLAFQVPAFILPLAYNVVQVPLQLLLLLRYQLALPVQLLLPRLHLSLQLTHLHLVLFSQLVLVHNAVHFLLLEPKHHLLNLLLETHLQLKCLLLGLLQFRLVIFHLQHLLLVLFVQVRVALLHLLDVVLQSVYMVF